MDVPGFNLGPSSSSTRTTKRQLESSASAPSSSSSSASSTSSAGGLPKPWVDDGVEDGEDTDEMDLAALQKEFAADDDDDEAENQGQFSPKVTQVCASPSCSSWPRVSLRHN
jgi:hypothetical protein